MKINLRLFIVFIFVSTNVFGQINTSNITIVRDKWGVPHIHGNTDKDAAFSLAYAHAQDDFFTIQESLLKARGKYASVYGEGENKINEYNIIIYTYHNVDHSIAHTIIHTYHSNAHIIITVFTKLVAYIFVK